MLWANSQLCAAPQKTLDSKQGKDYTKYTKSGGEDPPLLVPPVQKRAKKANMTRMNDPRETACGGAEGEGKNSQAKGSDQDGTSESARQRRCTPKGQLILIRNLSGNDGGRRTKGVFLSLFLRKNSGIPKETRFRPYRPSATSPGGGSKSGPAFSLKSQISKLYWTEEKHERTETHPTL